MSTKGIGGFFFRADDPEMLADWYQEHLGVGADVASPWVQESGPILVMPFARDSDAWPTGKEWMLNVRVDDLDALVTSLAAAGIAVTTDPVWDTPETGRFARVTDPEGNPVELWEPPSD